jgi:hypothetical protein
MTMREVDEQTVEFTKGDIVIRYTAAQYGESAASEVSWRCGHLYGVTGSKAGGLEPAEIIAALYVSLPSEPLLHLWNMVGDG